jgi:hypothetical protein
MFPRRSATEILSHYQNACARVTRMIENKRWVVLALAGATPIVEQKLTKTRTLNPLQKLLGNNLIGIHIRSMERRDATFVSAKGPHYGLPRLLI